MKLFVRILCFCWGFACLGQYQFKGTFPKKYARQTAFLSLVEDYRKVDRVYRSQIIQKAVIDTTGNFVFTGKRLAAKNRMYRIHIDDCPETQAGKNHYLVACTRSTQVMFLANNSSTLLFPKLSNEQPLCQINGGGPNAGALLEVDYLKEAMILDFMESHSITDEQLKFESWFEELQQFALNSGEPLVELYVHDFLSDKKNESHSYYIKDLSDNPYYKELGERLEQSYADAPFVNQYLLELRADALLSDEKPNTSMRDIALSVIGLGILLGVFGILKHRKRRKAVSSPIPNELTPQEQRIYQAIQDNKSNKEIALELFISTSTVKTHINNIYKKLDVSSRGEIIKNPPGV